MAHGHTARKQSCPDYKAGGLVPVSILFITIPLVLKVVCPKPLQQRCSRTSEKCKFLGPTLYSLGQKL